MTRDLETRDDIDALMINFYENAMADGVIGYLFTDLAHLDLAHHLPVIGDFWETVLFSTGAYRKHGRNPLVIHAALHEKSPLLPEHFQRWLELFGECVDKLFAGPRAEFAKLRARGVSMRMIEYLGNC